MALCKAIPTPNLFFGDHVCGAECDEGVCKGKSEPGRVARIRAAKALCAVCPEQAACLTWAIENNVMHGIWGGKSERERTKMRLDERNQS